LKIIKRCGIKNNEFSLIAFAGACWGIWGSGVFHRFLLFSSQLPSAKGDGLRD
jgi:hypothetical protein